MQNYLESLERIKDSQNRSDGFDYIFLPNDPDLIREVGLHEFTHIVVKESNDTFDLSRRVRDSRDRGLARFNLGVQLYIDRRRSEVKSWVNTKEKELGDIIDLITGMSTSEREEYFVKTSAAEDRALFHQVLAGLENLGEEKLIEYYHNILDAFSLEWQVTEEIAETGEYIFTGAFDNRGDEYYFDDDVTNAQSSIIINRFMLQHCDDEAERIKLQDEIDELQSWLDRQKENPVETRHQIVRGFLENFGK